MNIFKEINKLFLNLQENSDFFSQPQNNFKIIKEQFKKQTKMQIEKENYKMNNQSIDDKVKIIKSELLHINIEDDCKNCEKDTILDFRKYNKTNIIPDSNNQINQKFDDESINFDVYTNNTDKLLLNTENSNTIQQKNFHNKNDSKKTDSFIRSENEKNNIENVTIESTFLKDPSKLQSKLSKVMKSKNLINKDLSSNNKKDIDVVDTYLQLKIENEMICKSTNLYYNQTSQINLAQNEQNLGDILDKDDKQKTFQTTKSKSFDKKQKFKYVYEWLSIKNNNIVSDNNFRQEYTNLVNQQFKNYKINPIENIILCDENYQQLKIKDFQEIVDKKIAQWIPQFFCCFMIKLNLLSNDQYDHLMKLYSKNIDCFSDEIQNIRISNSDFGQTVFDLQSLSWEIDFNIKYGQISRLKCLTLASKGRRFFRIPKDYVGLKDMTQFFCTVNFNQRIDHFQNFLTLYQISDKQFTKFKRRFESNKIKEITKASIKHYYNMNEAQYQLIKDKINEQIEFLKTVE